MSIQLTNLTLTYDRHPAVHHLSATIERGDLMAIIGPNGAGKSTLLNALAGLASIADGSIGGLGSDEVAYLPQQTQIDRSFPITVAELVATGLWQRLGLGKALCNQHKDQISEAIAAVGLEGFEDRLIGSLSGGQMQRSLFARVLLQDQPVILLDEPFNAIDQRTIADLTEVIKSWHKDTRTVIMVSHDMDYVRQHCPKAILLARECVDQGETGKVLTLDNLKRARLMCEAFDNNADWCEQVA